MTQKQEVNSSKIWNNLGKYGLAIVTVFVLVSLIRNVSLLLLARNRLKQAQAELSAQTAENQKLEDAVSESEKASYEEKIIRDKLGLSHEGETVFVLPNEDVLRKLSPRVEKNKTYTLPDPNWKKWLKLFM